MAVMKMQRITVCALKKNRKAILERLQALGTVEIDIGLKEEEGLMKMDITGSRNTFLKYAQTADQAMEILRRYTKEKESMFASLAGKPLVEKKAAEQIIKQKDKQMAKARELIALEKEIGESKAAIQKLDTQIESLKPWLSVSVPMNFRGTAQTAMMIGTLPGVMDQETVLHHFNEHAPEVEAVDMEIVSVDRDFTYLAVLCMKADRVRVENALRAIGFAVPSQLPAKQPAELTAELQEQIRQLEAEIQRKEKEILGYREEKQNFQIVSDYFRVRADKYEVLGELPQTEHVFFISGYIPEERARAVAEELTEKYEAMAELSELTEKEEAPVLLKNNKFASCGEGVLKSFGLPAKGEIDPTFIMTCCYIFLFGLMLSDAAYGLIVMIACGVMLVKFPRMSDGMRKSLSLFFWCGLSTAFWGVMFGGYFGDLIDVVSATFFGHEVSIPAVWFVPLDDPMRMLVMSLLFGCIHLFLGLGIKGYMCLRDKNYMGFVCDVVFWYCLLIGLILILIPTEIFASIAQISVTFPAPVNTLAIVLAAGGAIGILLMAGRRKKNPALRLALGAYDLYNITSWLSDVLSYSRLLALGLATGVIASVVNQMGSMGGGGILGAIMFIIVFLIGHTFNLAINLLGAYVHTCRLQYVEFFGKFFEGGGREFNPFRENTKYVDIKEETTI